MEAAGEESTVTDGGGGEESDARREKLVMGLFGRRGPCWEGVRVAREDGFTSAACMLARTAATAGEVRMGFSEGIAG